MGRVTSKLQVTVPKDIANRYSIRPGDSIEWTAAADSMRVVKVQARSSRGARDSVAQRLRRFDEATKRQMQRQQKRKNAHEPHPGSGRGWKREDLYHRGSPR